jgi:hypothetical protein
MSKKIVPHIIELKPVEILMTNNREKEEEDPEISPERVEKDESKSENSDNDSPKQSKPFHLPPDV